MNRVNTIYFLSEDMDLMEDEDVEDVPDDAVLAHEGSVFCCGINPTDSKYAGHLCAVY